MAATWDLTELRQAAQEIAGAAARTRPSVKRETRKAAIEIRERARDLVRGRLSGRSHLKNYPQGITYEMLGETDAEIGAEGGVGQGGRGRGVEFGSSNAPPIPHLLPAFDEVAPRWESAVSRRLGDRVWR